MRAETTTWPGWETVRLLGSGSFGKVYEIRREVMGKTERAALKVIRIPREASELQSVLNEGMTEEEATAYFRGFVEDITDEFGLMSKLTGLSNIVTCHDCDVIEDADGIGWTILIRMELLTPILARNKKQPFSEEDVVRMGIDICRALEICWEDKIIHRDIKPENIFINSHGDYKLGDFGIARTMEKTMASMSQKGTETYMAPEVILGKEYGYTVDIYSLSTVLYRFLNNNRTPFLPQGTIRWEDRENAKNRKTTGEKVPAPLNGTKKLKAVVLKGLAYEPDKRYSSAKEMRAALEKCLLDYDNPGPRPIPSSEGPGIPIPDGPSPDSPTPDEESTIGGNPFPNPPKPIGSGKGPEPPVPPEPKPKRKPIKWVILFDVLLLVVLCILILIMIIREHNLEVGSTLIFGSYEQDNDLSNGSEPIEWLVLDKQDSKVMAISKYGLDAKAYNSSKNAVTWETSSLRRWLNETFYQEAFSEEEKRQITETKVVAEVNTKYGTHAGEDTIDRVFLLSISEAEGLFQNDDARVCYPTLYAKAQGAWSYKNGKGSCWWLLRSPGYNSGIAANVYFDGSVYYIGYIVANDNISVRPALWIDLGS